MKKQPKPLLPPFPVGTKLRNINKTTVSLTCKAKDSDKTVLLEGPGLEVIIDEVIYGRQGSGAIIDYYDDGEPILDTTRNGYSVYHVGGHGRLIRAENAKNWKVIK